MNMTPKNQFSFPSCSEFMLTCANIAGTESANRVPALVFKAVGREANRVRHDHYYQGIEGKYGRMHWAFGRRNAGDFLIYNKKELNHTDSFYTTFFVKWSNMEAAFKADVLKLKVSFQCSFLHKFLEHCLSMRTTSILQFEEILSFRKLECSQIHERVRYYSTKMNSQFNSLVDKIKSCRYGYSTQWYISNKIE
jgi:hypothetical protein